jgi:hypothetical protein
VSSAYAFGTQDDVVLSRNVWQASTASYETITQTLTRPLPDEISAFVKQNLAIHFQLEHLARTSEGSRRNEFLRYSYNSHLAMQKYLIETASKTHPEEARKVMWEYRLTFIPEHDKDLPAWLPSPQQDPAFYGFKRWNRSFFLFTIPPSSATPPPSSPLLPPYLLLRLSVAPRTLHRLPPSHSHLSPPSFSTPPSQFFLGRLPSFMSFPQLASTSANNSRR